MEYGGSKTGYYEKIVKQLNMLFIVLIIQTAAEVLFAVLKYVIPQSEVLPLITGIITLGMMAVMFVVLLPFRKEDSSLTTALVFYALLFVAAVAVVFLSSRLYTYYFFSIILIIYYYFVYAGMAKLCAPFPGLSKKWEKLFFWMFLSLVAVSVLAYLVYRFMFFDAGDGEEAASHPLYIIIVLLFLADALFLLSKLVPAVWYAVYLYKSRKAFAGADVKEEERQLP